MPNQKPDKKILELCAQVSAKRPKTVIDHIIKHGFVTTEELQGTYGYDHPPRAIQDVKDNGIPLEMFKVDSTRTGRKIAAYRFGDPTQIKKGRIGGRKAFSKRFKELLVEKYGSRDTLTGEKLEPRYLQIDHRIPFDIAGDGNSDENVEHYMLLDASSQRAKSWSCEHCDNAKSQRNIENCKTCYWAFPETYTHVALRPVRRLDLVWQGADDVSAFEKLQLVAKQQGISLQAAIKLLLSKSK